MSKTECLHEVGIIRDEDGNITIMGISDYDEFNEYFNDEYDIRFKHCPQCGIEIEKLIQK